MGAQLRRLDPAARPDAAPLARPSWSAVRHARGPPPLRPDDGDGPPETSRPATSRRAAELVDRRVGYRMRSGRVVLAAVAFALTLGCGKTTSGKRADPPDP